MSSDRTFLSQLLLNNVFKKIHYKTIVWKKADVFSFPFSFLLEWNQIIKIAL